VGNILSVLGHIKQNQPVSASSLLLLSICPPYHQASVRVAAAWTLHVPCNSSSCTTN
jgi:hypothetical protein